MPFLCSFLLLAWPSLWSLIWRAVCAGVACSSVVDCFSFNSFLLLAWPSPLVFKNLALARRVRRCFLLALPWLIASPLTLFFRWPGLPLWSFGLGAPGAPAWAALPVIYVFVFRFARRNLKGDLEEGAWNKGERKLQARKGVQLAIFKAQRTSRLMEKALPRFCQGIEFNCMTGRVSAEMEVRILPGPFFCVYKSGWIKEKNHQNTVNPRQNTVNGRQNTVSQSNLRKVENLNIIYYIGLKSIVYSL